MFSFFKQVSLPEFPQADKGRGPQVCLFVCFESFIS